jgi:cytochrome c5
MLKRRIISGLLLGIGSVSFYALAADNSTTTPMITNRHHPEKFIQSIQNDPDAGKKIYQQFCSTCHAKNPEISVGAPRIGVQKDWKNRLKKGVDGLLTVTVAGINQMPSRGGCFECNDAQLKAAIVYMLPASHPKNHSP